MTSRDHAGANVSDWLRLRSREPSWITTRIEEPVIENAGVSIDVFPSIDRRDLNGCPSDPKFSHGYEIPFTLLNQRLSSQTAPRLKTILSLIRHLHGLSSSEGLAFLAHLFLFSIDVSRPDYATTLFLGLPPQG